MTHDDDPLEGEEHLSARQLAAVHRYTARAGRHQHDHVEPTNRDRWAAFQRAEQADENERFYHS